MFIYTSPVQFKKDSVYVYIDNSIVSSSHQDYKFENKENCIKTFYPETLDASFRIEYNKTFIEFKVVLDTTGFAEARQAEYENMYGDKVSAVIYERNDMDMVFYSTHSGIKTEIVLKEFSKKSDLLYSVQSSATAFENNPYGYVVLKKEENVGVIQGPMIQDANGKMMFNDTCKIEMNQTDTGFSLQLRTDDKFFNNEDIGSPMRFDLSFDLCQSAMPDSGVLSEGISTNLYLSSNSIIGKHEDYGIGRQYMRLRIGYFIASSYKDVNTAYFNVKCLNGSKRKDIISLHRSKEQWSSTQILWENQIGFGQEIAQAKINQDNYFKFEITSFVKECLDDPSMLTESMGLVLKAANEEESYYILASSDHSLYPSFIEIIFNKLPDEFTAQQTINSLDVVKLLE